MNIQREENYAVRYIDITTKRLSQVKDAADDNSLVVANIGRVGYRGDGVYSWGQMAQMVEDAGADAITLHLPWLSLKLFGHSPITPMSLHQAMRIYHSRSFPKDISGNDSRNQR